MRRDLPLFSTTESEVLRQRTLPLGPKLVHTNSPITNHVPLVFVPCFASFTKLATFENSVELVWNTIKVSGNQLDSSEPRICQPSRRNLTRRLIQHSIFELRNRIFQCHSFPERWSRGTRTQSTRIRLRYYWFVFSWITSTLILLSVFAFVFRFLSGSIWHSICKGK